MTNRATTGCGSSDWVRTAISSDRALGPTVIVKQGMLWGSKTNETMDKGRFRRDPGMVGEGYQEMVRKLLASTVIESFRVVVEA
jgi:hypothetical protein